MATLTYFLLLAMAIALTLVPVYLIFETARYLGKGGNQ